MSSDQLGDGDLPIKFTDAAICKISQLVEHGMGVNLRIRIVSGGCNGLRYDFTLDGEIGSGDVSMQVDNTIVVVDRLSLQYLAGGLVDYREDLCGSRFLIEDLQGVSCSCGLSFDPNR